MTLALIRNAIQRKTDAGELKGHQGMKALIAWYAIKNREASHRAYEDHLREAGLEALASLGSATNHWELDRIADEIARACVRASACA